MHFSIFLLLFGFLCIEGKTHVKSLTESMGQEVIEMGSPIKELPPGLDEEPSAEFDEDEKTTGTIAQPATKRETRKSTTVSSSTTEQKTTSDGRRSNAFHQDDEEQRIEKELSDIYKDTDYKADSTKEVQQKVDALKYDEIVKPKPVARARENFKFQPDVNDRADVERFRTSVDEISCEKRVTQRLHDEVTHSERLAQSVVSSGSSRLLTNSIAMSLAFISIYVCQ